MPETVPAGNPYRHPLRSATRCQFLKSTALMSEGVCPV